MNQITHHDFGLFETELLSVDFISFNITRITSQRITRLASYFQNLGFNSYNQFEVYFILKIPYQKEIIQLQFPGVSGKQFYKLIKQRAIQWNKFTNPVFSRLDDEKSKGRFDLNLDYARRTSKDSNQTFEF